MAFVLSKGQIKAVGAPPYDPFVNNRLIKIRDDRYMTYEALWRTQPAIRTVVGFLARNIASLGLGVYSGGNSDLDRHRERNHPFERIMRSPLLGTKLTRFRLVVATFIDRGIYDNAYWLKLRAGDGTPAGVLPIPARMVSLPPGETNWFQAESYRITGSNGHVDVPASNIVHFHGYSPDDPRRGTSPIETIKSILQEEISAQTYRSQLWRNGARFAGYIQRPQATRKWDPADRQRFLEHWRAQYAGDTANWLYGGGTPILEDGMSFIPAGVTPKDAQYIESRKLTREEVAAAYWVPPSAVGIFDSGTSHNAMESQRESLYRDALPPWCDEMAQDLECQLLYDLDPDALDGSKYVEFNLQEKLTGGFLEQTKVLQSAVGGPWMSRAEARKIQNLSYKPGTDELIVPMNVTEGGLASPNDTAPDNPDNEESNAYVPRSFVARMGRSVVSKVGAGAPIDWARWTTELVEFVPEATATSYVAAVKDKVEAAEGVAGVRAAFAQLEEESHVE